MFDLWSCIHHILPESGPCRTMTGGTRTPGSGRYRVLRLRTLLTPRCQGGATYSSLSALIGILGTGGDYRTGGDAAGSAVRPRLRPGGLEGRSRRLTPVREDPPGICASPDPGESGRLWNITRVISEFRHILHVDNTTHKPYVAISNTCPPGGGCVLLDFVRRELSTDRIGGRGILPIDGARAAPDPDRPAPT